MNHGTDPAKLYRPLEAARLLGVSRQTLYRAVAAGRLAPPIRVSLRAVAWEATALGEYLRACNADAQRSA